MRQNNSKINRLNIFAFIQTAIVVVFVLLCELSPVYAQKEGKARVDSAKKYMSIHLKMAQKYNLKGEIMIVTNRFGYLFMAQSKLDSAYTMISFVLNYFKLIESYRMLAENYTTLSKIRFRQYQEQQNQHLNKQSEKLASLGMLTAGIAHEINNPLNFINSGAISLQRDYEDLQRIIESIDQLPPETQKLANELEMNELRKIIPQTIADIKTGVQRTTEIVKGLRNFTRLDASELKDINLHEGINSTLLMLNHKLKDRINIIREFDPDIGLVKCYPGQLNQVFMNLLKNAVDAIYQKIQQDLSVRNRLSNVFNIRIITKLSSDNDSSIVKILISDNGVGMNHEVKEKLFDPFYTTKEVGMGTGLGLYICHGIIEKHGGSITFDSLAGEGSTMYLLRFQAWKDWKY